MYQNVPQSGARYRICWELRANWSGKLSFRMKIKKIDAFLALFQRRHEESEARSAGNLFIFQFIYLVLILATIVLCIVVDQGERLLFYLLLLGGLEITVAGALAFNLSGRYRTSTVLTAICMVLGPWLSILFDPAVLAGDFVPLIYIGMSIQLCSILLRERVTIIIAAIQLSGVIAAILLSPALRAINWPSLVTFILFTAVIGILYGFSNNRQLQEIEKQRNQLIADENQLRELSVRDSLSGLFNRRYMEETFDREILRAIRKQQSLSVIMTDIDGFKVINDSVGHVLGDKVLVKVSHFLMQNIRASDVACRYGGDEFCLIMPDCSLEEGNRRADALRAKMETIPFNQEEDGIEKVTLSFGVAALPDNGMTREELLNAADSALYSAKRAGRNRVGNISMS